MTGFFLQDLEIQSGVQLWIEVGPGASEAVECISKTRLWSALDCVAIMHDYSALF